MKQLSFSALLLLVVLITGSCKKIPVVNYTNSSISFKIDGAYKEAKGNQNVFGIHAKEEKGMIITGDMDAAGDQQISLLINNFHGVGEYSGEENILLVYTTPEFKQSILGSEGTIKITEFTDGKSIKGEFQIKGKAFIINMGDPDNDTEVTKIFSEGKFEAKVTTGPIVEPD
ncbi:hypothetical protein SAMN04487898_11458 [Pedobacter sp. ok626]|uniref:hypothetical protein n=1 Tax=Pedobacter sp. ok626 TaxID=1761882 RepID=UPI00088958A8|nr:hypothetical protein [Pedobacter sp. ok626]SDL02883.1 hypothetical protein SAMN04487898_11458 [Pedobacter sp. ok626]